MPAMRENTARCLLFARLWTRSSIFHHLTIVLLLFTQLSQQQKDPIKDFCRRFGQQTAVVDRKLYIDGGLVNWNPISQNPSNITNQWLLYNDLDSINSAGMPNLYANLSTNGTIPSVSGGTLWADEVNKRIYLFAGESSTPSSFTLFAYDTIYNVWNSFGPPDDAIDNVAWGAGATVPERGEGYYYGGWISNTTTPGFTGDPIGSTGLVRYSMDQNDFSNNTGPDDIPRAEGVMVYIPASDRGLLLYFGGANMPYFNSTANPAPMSDIFIYDIASSNWYTQEATGNIPNPRRRFCAGATWAPDRSSYNIYLYGGAGFAPNASGYDDVYILSVPSFTWIKWYPSDNEPGRPHGSLTCNVIDGAQMLIIGGTFPDDDDCDAPTVYGTHNLDLGKQNSDKAQWHAYQPNLTSYIVPPEIISEIGGNSLGGATVTAPATWANHDLPVYFTRRATVVSRTATRSIPTPSATTATTTPTHASNSSKKLSTGAIAGIAVGGACVLLLLAFGCFCLRRHRKNNLKQPQPPPSELPNQYDPHGISYQASPQHQYIQPTPLVRPAELAGYQTPHLHHVSIEPKYDAVAAETLRHDSIHHESNNPQAVYGGWPQQQSNSPHPSQQYITPTLSPHPSTFSSATSEPLELSGSRPQPYDQASPAPTYTSVGRKQVPASPGRDYYQR